VESEPTRQADVGERNRLIRQSQVQGVEAYLMFEEHVPGEDGVGLERQCAKGVVDDQGPLPG
jgi:hypothetical protein